MYLSVWEKKGKDGNRSTNIHFRKRLLAFTISKWIPKGKKYYVILCLESDIRKAQTNKESVMAVFFDIEKAYDMLWNEGLLI